VARVLVVVLIGLGGLLALAGVLFLLLKLGAFAHTYTRPEPVDHSGGHTLAQSSEAGQPAAATRDDAR
jgi:hypothetical protein